MGNTSFAIAICLWSVLLTIIHFFFFFIVLIFLYIMTHFDHEFKERKSWHKSVTEETYSHLTYRKACLYCRNLKRFADRCLISGTNSESIIIFVVKIHDARLSLMMVLLHWFNKLTAHVISKHLHLWFLFLLLSID